MYSLLDSSRKEIRLLQLYRGVWKEDIICSLIKVALLDQPSYNALSYVWGDQQDRKPITINGQPTTITRNLFEALQRIREEDATVIIWIDALCINQADLDERCQQVQLMRDIYSSAEEVFIWLGYGGSMKAPQMKPEIHHWTGTDADIGIIEEYFRRADTYDETGDLKSSLRAFVYLRLCASNKHVHEMPFFPKQDGRTQHHLTWPLVVKALDTFLNVPWWTRVWVLQEVVLARKARVLYGSMTAPWDMLAQAAKYTHAHYQFCCHEIIDNRPLEDLQVLLKVWKVVQDDIERLRFLRIHHQDTEVSLFQLMPLALHRKATDLRDKVYGLLGLVTDWYDGEPMVPDYRLEFRDVIMQATVGQLRGTNSLRYLMGVPSPYTGLPCWIKQASNSDQWRTSQEGRVHRTGAFCAAGATSVKVQLDGDVLILDCFAPVDAIAFVGPAMFHHSAEWHNSVDVIKAWRQICPPFDEYGEEVFWRTVLNDCIQKHPDEHKGKEYDPRNHSSFRRLEHSDVINISKDWWTWFQSMVPGNQNRTGKESPKRAMDRVRLIHESFLNSTALRSFFVTTAGRMGMGPPDIRVGDDIVLMRGGDTPFCVRDDKMDSIQRAELIGDVYVHGLMDGEGLPPDWRQKIVQMSLI